MRLLVLTALLMSVCGTGAALSQERAVPLSQAQVQLSYAPIVARAAPAVVNVYSNRIVRQAVNPFFQQFFGEGPMRSRVEQSLGSGVIVRGDGVILTNHHVVNGGTDIKVALTDRREYTARILLSDPRTDLAVLKIDPGPREFARAAIRRLRPHPGRRSRARHRRSLRRRPDRDERHRLRVGAFERRRVGLSVLHPDRCRDQSRQFRRRAGDDGWPAHRHQLIDRLGLRRQYRHRLRHSVQHGPRRRGRRAQRRYSTAMARRRRPGGDRRDRAQHGSSASRRRAALSGASAQSCRAGRICNAAMS